MSAAVARVTNDDVTGKRRCWKERCLECVLSGRCVGLWKESCIEKELI